MKEQLWYIVEKDLRISAFVGTRAKLKREGVPSFKTYGEAIKFSAKARAQQERRKARSVV